MSILKIVDKHYNSETKKIEGNFKIVYISPLKALATEVVRKFSKKLDFLKVIVKEFTGDISLTKKELN